jgi:hypothetical protein
MAGTRKLDRGTKKGTRIHIVSADILMEIRDAVMALDVASPRRIKTWLTAKQRAASMEKYTVIR